MPTFEIVNSTAEGLRIQREILEEAAKAGYEDPERFAIQLSVEEALVNAIKHGNRSDPAKKVRGSYEVTDREVRVRIEDEGLGFDRNTIPDCTEDENLERPCGRGLKLMEHYMTEVRYNKNRVEMVLRRKNPSTGDQQRTGNDTIVDFNSGDTQIISPESPAGGTKEQTAPPSRSPERVTVPPKNRRRRAVFASAMGPEPETIESLQS